MIIQGRPVSEMMDAKIMEMLREHGVVYLHKSSDGDGWIASQNPQPDDPLSPETITIRGRPRLPAPPTPKLTDAEVEDLRAALPTVVPNSKKLSVAMDAARWMGIVGLIGEVTRSRALLRRIEWKGTGKGDAPTCPECGGFAPNLVTNPSFERWPPPFQGTKVDHAGHKPGCELAALIGGK